jgi:hypothetical protein
MNTAGGTMQRGPRLNDEMLKCSWLLVTIVACAWPVAATASAKDHQAAAPLGERAPVLWLERLEKAKPGGQPLLQAIPADDPRRAEAERLIDNEAATFTRTLVAWAWKTFGRPATWADGRLPILLQPGGNNAAVGFRLQDGERVTEHPDVPYLILALEARSLGDTVIHEGGHVLQTIAGRGRRAMPRWSAVLHSTFAVTDPLTALAEGFGIHFETLAGHYGQEADRRNFYHRLAPAFDLKGRRSEFYAPVGDLMTFAQSWARYQAVRETWPVFAGHVYPGDYLRSQYDPARDRSVLQPANAMIASEGTVASVLFWISAGLAGNAGATPGAGLMQAGVLDAERTLLRAFSTLARGSGFRPDLVDLVTNVHEAGSPERGLAISRFVSVTRAVTADREVRARWTSLYKSALALDIEATKPQFAALDATRDAVVEAALGDPSVLRGQLGPVLPVRQEKVLLELKALGQKFALQFDLNAAGQAEWLAAGVERAVFEKALAERDRAPFASVTDFEQRVGRPIGTLGLTPVRMDDSR